MNSDWQTLEATAGNEEARLVAADHFLERQDNMLLKQFVNAARSENPATRSLSEGLWGQFLRDQLISEFPGLVERATAEDGHVTELTWQRGADREAMSRLLRSPLLARLGSVGGDDVGAVLAASMPALEQLLQVEVTTDDALRELLSVGLPARIRTLQLHAWPALDLVEQLVMAPVTSQLEWLVAYLTDLDFVSDGVRLLARSRPTLAVELHAFHLTDADANAFLAALGEERLARLTVHHG
jgi:hypothetical protein